MKFLAGLITLMFAFPVIAGNKTDTPANPACEADMKKNGADKKPPELTPEQIEAAEIMQLLLGAREKYYARLMPATNPFYLSFTLEEAEGIFNALSKIPDPDAPSVKFKRSILGEVNHILTTQELKSLDQVKPVLNKLFAYTAEVVDNQYSENPALYRGSVAVDLLLQALQPFFPAPQYQKDDEKKEKDKQKKEKKDDDESDGEPGQEMPPEYPDDDDQDYDPHNKDTKKGKGKTQERFIAAQVNIPGVAYFKVKYFNTAKRHGGGRKRLQVTPLEPWEKILKPHGNSDYTLKLFPGKKTEFDVLMPLGYEPRDLNPRYRGTMTALPTGKYRVKLQEPIDGPVEISLDQEEAGDLTPIHLMFLKSAYGIKDEEWPLHIRTELLPKIKGRDVKTAATVIENYLRHEYKYRVGAGTEKDIIEALSTDARSFQCDYGAEIMVAMMKDYMKMPCRVVDVYRGQYKGGDDKNSYLSLPNERHVMVECIDGSGKKLFFDPTPKKKDETEDDKGDKNNPFRDNSKFEEDEDEDKEGQHEGEETDEQADDVDNTAEHKKKIKADTEKSRKDNKVKETGSGSGKQKPDKNKENGKDGQNPESEPDKVHENQLVDPDELRDFISDLGNMSLQQPKKVAGTLDNRARQLYMRKALDPRNDTVTALNMVNLFEVDSGFDHSWRPRVKEAKVALDGRQRAIPQALISLAGGARETDPVTTFKRLVQIEDRLHVFAKTQDDNQKDGLTAIIDKVRQVKTIFQKLNEDAELEIAMATKFYKGLPPHARQLVGGKYKISSVGQNAETAAMQKDLDNGKLRDFNVMRILYPLTDFIMDSTPTPAYKMSRTVMRDYQFQNGSDLLPLTNIAEGYRALVTDPHASITMNMLKGQAHQYLRRQRVRIQAPGGQKQPKRVTVVGYDTSGSMEGGPGDFQASILAAFTDRALSDIVAGKHMHQCVLMGFDDDVHTVHPVFDSQAAYKVIQGYRENLKNTGKGTSIMNVLRKALNAIIDAQSKSDEPLASANVILMSDGGSDVDMVELRNLMSKIDRRTPVKFMFIGINGTNPHLIELTNTIKQAGAAEGLYVYFSSERIKELLEEGEKAPKADKKRELYTKKGADHVPLEVQSMLTSLSHQLDAELIRLDSSQHPRDIPVWLHEMSRAPIIENPPGLENTEISLEFGRLRGILARSDVMKDKFFVRAVVDDVLRNFQRTFGKSLNNIILLERENINHTLTAVQAYAAGRGRD